MHNAWPSGFMCDCVCVLGEGGGGGGGRGGTENTLLHIQNQQNSICLNSNLTSTGNSS